MSERYTRLFSLPGNLHTPKAPCSSWQEPF